jgi:hypothetical protein
MPRKMLGAVCVWLGACMLPAAADESAKARRFLFFSGVDLSSLSVFSWGGVDAPLTRAPHGAGPLVRIMGGAGRYDYDKEDAPDGEVIGDVMLGEALLGWRFLNGPLCVTVLAGFAIEDHELDVPDPENDVQGTEKGMKIVAELFWRPTEEVQVEASAAYASTFDFWRVRLAAGHAFKGAVLGAETEAFGNIGSDQIRAGLFISDIDWRRYEFKLSAGVLDDGDNTGAYGRIGMDARF